MVSYKLPLLQLVTIHGEIGDKFVMPLLYVYFVNKTKKLYKRFLRILKTKLCKNEFKPKIWVCDFEIGWFRAVLDICSELSFLVSFRDTILAFSKIARIVWFVL